MVAICRGKYLEIYESVRRDAQKLSRILCEVTNAEIPVFCVQQMVIPFLAFLTLFQGRPEIIEQPNVMLPFNNLNELVEGFWPPRSGALPRDVNFQEQNNYDVLLGHSLNRYERLVYGLFLKYKVVDFSDKILPRKEQETTSVSAELRIKVSERISQEFDGPNFTSFIPKSLLENLSQYKYIPIPSSFPPLIWLSGCMNEKYLYLISHAKLSGSICYLEPHGAHYFQYRDPPPQEIYEYLLADYYGKPSWSGDVGSVNLRASRNYWLAIKYRLGVILREKHLKSDKILVVLPILPYDYVRLSYKDYLTSLYREVVVSLIQRYGSKLLFRVNPWQAINEIESFFAEYSNKMAFTSNDQLITRAAFDFDKIIIIETCTTVLMELHNIPVDVIVFIPFKRPVDVIPAPFDITESYRSFLLQYSEVFVDNLNCLGSLRCVDRSRLKRAFGARILYPFYYLFLFKALIGRPKTL